MIKHYYYDSICIVEKGIPRKSLRHKEDVMKNLNRDLKKETKDLVEELLKERDAKRVDFTDYHLFVDSEGNRSCCYNDI